MLDIQCGSPLHRVSLWAQMASVGENTLGRNASLPQLGTMGEIERRQLNLTLNSPPFTPLRVSLFKSLLSSYDPNLKDFLIHGSSSSSSSEVLSSKLDKERSAGRTVGPFSSQSPFRWFCLFALRRRSQENPGRVSNYSPFIIPRRLFSQWFYSLRKIYGSLCFYKRCMIKSIGRGSYMSTTDIKSAFRIIPIHLDD